MTVRPLVFSSVVLSLACGGGGPRLPPGALELHPVRTNRSTTYYADAFGLSAYFLHMSIPWCSVRDASSAPGPRGPNTLRLEVIPGADLVLQEPDAWVGQVRQFDRMEPRILEFTFEEPVEAVITLHRSATCER